VRRIEGGTTMERCSICDGTAVPVREEREIRLGRRRTRVVHEFHQCERCGEEFFLPGQMDTVLRRAADRIREDEGLLGPQEIRAIRERYRLSQADFERLLGTGPKTVTRWERGTVVQNRATDSLLRLVAENPENAAKLARWHGVRLPDAA
jgi:HTH-type transcriptional regulator / antitoxin MqsA